MVHRNGVLLKVFLQQGHKLNISSRSFNHKNLRGVLRTLSNIYNGNFFVKNGQLFSQKHSPETLSPENFE